MTPLLLISAFVTTYMCYVECQSSCLTPTGSNGQCISIFDCQPLLTLVNKPRRTQQEVDLLQRSRCGFRGSTPQVCCPTSSTSKCITPNGEQGECIGIYSCPHVSSLLTPPVSNENLAFLQRSRCPGPERYSICCGPSTANPSVTSPSVTFQFDESVPSSDGVCRLSAAPPNPSNGCCGIDSGAGNKIIGGNATSVDQYPWLALIEYKKNNKIKLLCGAVLISGRYVLTAGHCVVGPVLSSGTPINVRLGEYDTENNGPDCVSVEGGGEDCTEGTVIIPIEQVIAHPDYSPTAALRRNDIALLRLRNNAPYTDFIRPICLPRSDINDSPPNNPLYAGGWGAVNTSVASSNIKLHVDLPIVSLQSCQPAYNVPRRRVTLWKGQICAGGVKGKDSCKGDSGGPLMFENDKTFEVVGIVSFGPSPCGLENIPGVYTNVFQYLPWIKRTIRP